MCWDLVSETAAAHPLKGEKPKEALADRTL